MKKVAYFPGCTLTNTAKNFDMSARKAMEKLGWELDELPRWNCCGTVSSLASDNLMNHLAPIRLLLRTQELETDKLTTLCSMCYNTLKRSDLMVKNDPDKLDKINSFMDEEDDYKGNVEVLHLLQLLKEIGFDKIKEQVVKPLKGLKVVAYYGCLLTRPKEVAIDDVEAPTIMNDLLTALGADATYDPFLTECCGSYHTVHNKELVADKAYKILNSAAKRGADAIVTSCPLCHFNLDKRQETVAEKYDNAVNMPILYFTQLLAIALGLDQEVCNFDIHHIDPVSLLKQKNFL